MKVPLMMLVEIPPLCKKVEVNIKEEREIFWTFLFQFYLSLVKLNKKEIINEK